MRYTLSIIIPCFNSGVFLKEAIESCYRSEFQDFEIIIINDGSYDKITLELFMESWPQNLKIVNQQNKGAAAARNFGVSLAQGEFLLFLDSDNRIWPDYLTKALQIIRQDSKIAVVYSKPYFFGGEETQETSRFDVKDFSLDSLLAGNYIDMCSLVRKSAFSEVGGFDENREIFFGEDWELWIRIAHANWKFRFLNEVVFDYRIRKGSLMDQIDQERCRRTPSIRGFEAWVNDS